LKDQDFLDDKFKLKLDPRVSKALIVQIKEDMKLFQRLNINDYSVLLGIHYLDQQQAKELERANPRIEDLIRDNKGGIRYLDEGDVNS